MTPNKKIELLEKYEHVNELSAADKDAVYDLASIGLIHLGVSRHKGIDKETAKITAIAKQRLNRERNKNKLKEFFYSLLFI
jgi:hypothetical protein